MFGKKGIIGFVDGVVLVVAGVNKPSPTTFRPQLSTYFQRQLSHKEDGIFTEFIKWSQSAFAASLIPIRYEAGLFWTEAWVQYQNNTTTNKQMEEMLFIGISLGLHPKWICTYLHKSV